MSRPTPPRRLRIAVVIEHVNRQAGQERVIAELLHGLAERHDFDLYCFSARDIPEDRVRVRRLWCPSRSNTFQAWWIQVMSALLLRPRRYDVILSQGGNCLVQNFALFHICQAARAEALHPRAGRNPHLRWRGLLRLRARWAAWGEARAVARCRGRLLAVSRALAEELAHYHGLSPAEIAVAENGVDHHLFGLGTRSLYRNDQRRQMGLADDEFVALFVGGRWLEKGLPEAIEAMSLMEEPGHLIVVGRGNETHFRRMADRLGVADRVHFVGYDEQIQRYYASADCLVWPSEADGFGLVVAEAAACGLPLVCTPAGISRTLVQDGHSGFLVQRDPARIAACLDRLACDPQLRERMGRRAHELAQPLTWPTQARLVEDFLLRRIAVASGTEAERAPRLRVAILSHSCVMDVNQRLYAEMARLCPDLELRVVAPAGWRNSLGGTLRFTALPEAETLVQPLPVVLPGRIHLHYYAPRRLRRALADFRPDLILADAEPYSLVSRQAGGLAQALGAGLLIYAKQSIARGRPPPFPQLQRWVLGRLRHALVISPEAEQVLRAHGYRGTTTVVPHGVDTDGCAPSRNFALRERLGLGSFVVGYVGRLDSHKGVLDLLEAMRLLNQQRPGGASLLVVGDGPQRRAVEDLARRHLAAGQAQIIGYVPPPQVPEYLRAMDVLVLPSRTTAAWKEQFGRVLVEALACGVPVVGSDSGNIPHLIESTGGGLVFPEGEAPALAEKLAWLLDHPQEAADRAAQGRQVVEQEYSLGRTAQLMAEACRLAARSAAPCR